MFYKFYHYRQTIFVEINPENSGGIIIPRANVLLNNDLKIIIDKGGRLCPVMSFFSQNQAIKKHLAVTAKCSKIVFN